MEEEKRGAITAGKHAELLRVARARFVSHGYRATTMDDIAVLAGVSKRTLYMWHDDKAALFRACVIEGARLFPIPVVTPGRDRHDTLMRFALALATRMAEPDHAGMGRLLIREQRDFPELLPAANRSYELYVVEPLAAWLREQGLEAAGRTERARLFVAMALAPAHDELLLGRPGPDAEMAERHADLAARIFLTGAATCGDGC